MSETDKYGEAMGIWHLTIGGADLDLKPKKGDNRKFRKLVLNDTLRKDKATLYERFEGLMLEMIRRDYPPISPEESEAQEEYVEFNVNKLFEEVMLKFRWTSPEELEKGKKELNNDIKKLTEEA